MTTLRHPHIVDLRAAFRPAHIKPRPRGERLRAVGHALVIGSELLLALWATAVLAFCVVVIAGLVL